MSGYILLVDDSPSYLQLLHNILDARGYAVQTARHGLEALEKIKAQPPMLILLDINMPEMDGFALCEQLKNDPDTADIGVLFLSAHHDTETKVRCFAAGAVDYISKPFEEAEVLARLRTHLLILEQQRHLNGILNASLDGILTYRAVRDAEGQVADFRCLLANPRAAEIFGAAQEGLKLLSLKQQLSRLQHPVAWQELLDVFDHGQPLDTERYTRSRRRWLHMLAVPLEDGLALTLRDTSERKELELALARLAEQDSLTGLPNRRVFDRCLQQEWRRCRQAGEPLALIMCDIDYFKAYNDSQGHIAGDGCLVHVGRTLQQQVSWPEALVARYGGEEFGIILPRLPLSKAVQIADELLLAVRSLQLPHPGLPGTTAVTLSLGVATCLPDARQDMSELLQKADQALYQAKAQGRNQVVVAAAD